MIKFFLRWLDGFTPSIRRLPIWLMDTWCLILILTYNIIVLYTTSWNWNPIYDLFLAKTSGPIFTWTHTSSIMSLSFAFFWLWLKDSRFKYRNLAVISACVFPTIAIHEIAFNLSGLLFNFTTGMDLPYIQHLALIMGFGFFFAPKFAFVRWGVIFLIVLGFAFGVLITGFNATMIGGIPTANFDNLADNAIEVLSWIIPASVWFTVKRASSGFYLPRVLISKLK